MNTASTASHNLRDAARETAKDASEGVREIGKAASAASGNIESDMQSLRDDFARLAEQVGDILANKGDAAWQRAKSSVDDVLADAQGKGREAVGAMRDVSDNFVEAIDDSLKNRPYTTLAIAAGLGFLFGAMWRR
jgi:ElaB/YqjD/DUF883 family membrane-anchored ribosome-binding protein